MTNKIRFPEVVEIQINNDPPFIPEKIIELGMFLARDEKTGRGDAVRDFSVPSSCVVIHYFYNGHEFENYYRNGVWTSGANCPPRFCVSGLLYGTETIGIELYST